MVGCNITFVGFVHFYRMNGLYTFLGHPFIHLYPSAGAVADALRVPQEASHLARPFFLHAVTACRVVRSWCVPWIYRGSSANATHWRDHSRRAWREKPPAFRCEGRIFEGRSRSASGPPCPFRPPAPPSSSPAPALLPPALPLSSRPGRRGADPAQQRCV